MPSCTSSSEPTAHPRHATGLHRLWLGLFAAAYALLFGLLCVGFCTPAPYGDLTRLGALPESRFGWREHQPAIDPTLQREVPLAQADVLVVGDSFSAPRLWQSRLVQAGWAVHTLHWNDAHPLCEDFAPWLREQGFRGRWVLLQSVERALDERLRPDQACRHSPRPTPRVTSAEAALTAPPAAAFNPQPKLWTGVVTAWHGRQAAQATEARVFHVPGAYKDQARLEPFPEGCRRFSHADCHQLLVLQADAERVAPNRSHLPAIERAAGALANAIGTTDGQVAWVVVPDKRSHYLDRGPVTWLTGELHARHLGPDVAAAFTTRGAQLRDLYLPNDTHLSPAGALLLGSTVADWLARHPPPARP